MTTTDISKFGARERMLAVDLLTAWNEQGLPDDFWDEDVQLMMNQKSGNVFLTNENCDVAMMNGSKLETWHSCPICGWEGFAENMQHNPDNEECQEYVQRIQEGLKP